MRRWIVVLMTAALFVISLTQTAFVVDVTAVQDRVEPLPIFGIGLLFFGWIGMLERPELFGIGNVAVPQNLLVCLSIIAACVFACRKRLVATAIAALCVVALASVTAVRGPGVYAGSVGYVAWLANPGIALTCILYVREKQPAALISAVVSLCLSLSFLVVQEGPFGSHEHDATPIISLGIGYWLWVASAAALAMAVTVDAFLSRRSSTVSDQNVVANPLA